jgi:hypothetical protein
MKYAVEMDSGSMIYISSFHKDLFRYSKIDVIGFIGTQTNRK